METTFTQKHPYWAAVLAGLLCTLLTGLGMAIPQIVGLEETPTFIAMAIAVSVSALIGCSFSLIRASNPR